VGISVSPKVEGRRAREFEASDDEPAEKSNAIRTGSDRPSPGNFPTARNVLGYRVTKALRGVQERGAVMHRPDSRPNAACALGNSRNPDINH